ncbi:DapH/DapD/GlmU-related protein [Methylorubrum aminovorans]
MIAATFRKRHHSHPPTRIGSDVWIGAQSIIGAGLTIGHGANIAANPVVTAGVEPYSIVAGSPANEICKRFSEYDITCVLETVLWEQDVDCILKLPFHDINRCLEILTSDSANGVLPAFKEVATE